MAYTEIHNEKKALSRQHDERISEVPRFVADAVAEAVSEVLELHPEIRDEITKAVASRMGDDWRFCSCYRHENSELHKLIYAVCSTVGANFEADSLRKPA